MALFRTGKPNVKALAKRGDEDGLVAASGYQDLIAAPDGGMLDRGAAIRTEAILALGRLGPEAGTEAVRAALSDPADAVRVAAIRVLFAHRAAVPLASALAWLPADHGHSRALAIRALLELRVPECAPALAVALVNATGDAPVGDDEAALLQLLVHAATGADTAAEAVEALLVALADERDPVADRAEELLVLIAPVSTEDVIAELNAGAAPHRAAAVLARISDPRALAPLIEGLIHDDPRVRAECARALGELRDPAAVDALIHASRDPDDRVRSEASAALDRLGTVAMVVGVSAMIRPMIIEAVADSEARPDQTRTANSSSASNGSAGGGEVDAGVEVDEPPPDATRRADVERLLARLDHASGTRQL